MVSLLRPKDLKLHEGRKLLEHEVKQIFLDKITPSGILGSRYGVSRGCIQHIRKGKTWRWLTINLSEKR